MAQEFGDERTIRKLEIIEGYAQLFLEILGKLEWPITHYVDAFAGEGSFYLKGSDELVEGSVLRIGRHDFNRFHFVELDKRKCKELDAVISELGIVDKADVYQEDANKALPKIMSNLSKQDRFLIFLDPFGMELNWATLEEIAKMPCCDIVYLFPCHAILRATPTKSGGVLHKDMKDSTCLCLGMTEEEITEEFYQPRHQSTEPVFLEEMQQDLVLKSDDDRDKYGRVEGLVQRRLSSLFEYVFENPYRLEIEGRATLFSMFLMTSNPSKSAQNAIRRLGKHVFR